MELQVWLGFFVAAWAISISPGAGAVAAMSAGLNHGFKRGYWVTLGLVIGIWTQILVVSLGLGALIAASSSALKVIKWLGVAYLIWLGIKQWRAMPTPLVEQQPGAAVNTRWRLFTHGWVVNALNPKGTVFLLAVVPQFLNLQLPLAPQYAVIAATLGFTDLTVMAVYTLLAARLLRLLRSPRQIKIMNRCFGILFVVAGLVLAGFKKQS